jgi:hypothetical protein
MARDIFNWGFGHQINWFKASGSRQVTYAREYDSVDLVGMLGNRRYQTNDVDGGMRIEFSDLDVVFKLADFSFDGITPITPQRGDYIYMEQEDGSRVDIFEVLPLGDEGTHRIDPYKKRIVVHSKLSKTEDLYS